MREFIIIGISDSPEPELALDAKLAIRDGKFFSGGKRHHEIVEYLLPAHSEWIDIVAPLDRTLDRYSTIDDEIIVFASGDPLFYGFANTVKRHFPQDSIHLFPTFNSLQMLAHRLVLPYHDMRIVSLTGRPWVEFDNALICRAEKIGVLTDHQHTPSAIAGRMKDYGYVSYRMHIGEHLGNPEQEKVRTMSLSEAEDTAFSTPNCLILENAKPLSPRLYGIPDNEFCLLNGRERMITKMPIRLIDLQVMGLNSRRVFWDIGFCTGSVSIEARLMFPHLNVVSFEIRKEGRKLMDENSHKFGAPGITYVIADFVDADISLMPKPDAVFIGGHGGRLGEIMRKVETVLLPDGCIVMNAVTTKSRDIFNDTAMSLGMHIHESVRVSLDNYNPIEILKATK